MSVSALGAYDDNLVATLQNGSIDPQTQTSGPYNALDTRVMFTTHSRRLMFGASESSALRYYPTLSDITGIQHAASVGLNGTFGKTEVTVNQTFGYSPFYSFSTIPIVFDAQLGGPPPSVADSIVTERDTRTIGSSANLTQKIGGRTTLQFNASREDTSSQSEGTGLKVENIGGRLTRDLTRDLGLVLGYGVRQAHYRLSPSVTESDSFHNIEVGVDYHHALSLTRRTRVSFSTGSTLVKGAQGGSEYRLIGDARLTKEVGRTWQGVAAFHRGVGLVEGFHDPFFSDSFICSLGGAINSRVDISMMGGYSRGQLGVSASGSNNDSGNASAHMRVALSRTLALSGEYFFYRYHFDEGVALPAGMTPQHTRHGFRFGLDLWLPLIH